MDKPELKLGDYIKLSNEFISFVKFNGYGCPIGVYIQMSFGGSIEDNPEGLYGKVLNCDCAECELNYGGGFLLRNPSFWDKVTEEEKNLLEVLYDS